MSCQSSPLPTYLIFKYEHRPIDEFNSVRSIYRSRCQVLMNPNEGFDISGISYLLFTDHSLCGGKRTVVDHEARHSLKRIPASSRDDPDTNMAKWYLHSDPIQLLYLNEGVLWNAVEDSLSNDEVKASSRLGKYAPPLLARLGRRFSRAGWYSEYLEKLASVLRRLQKSRHYRRFVRIYSFG